MRREQGFLVHATDEKNQVTEKIEEFLVQAITRGSDDIGKVHMQVQYENTVFHGFGAHTDIITASVEAFLDAINKLPAAR